MWRRRQSEAGMGAGMGSVAAPRVAVRRPRELGWAVVCLHVLLARRASSVRWRWDSDCDGPGGGRPLISFGARCG